MSLLDGWGHFGEQARASAWDANRCLSHGGAILKCGFRSVNAPDYSPNSPGLCVPTVCPVVPPASTPCARGDPVPAHPGPLRNEWSGRVVRVPSRLPLRNRVWAPGSFGARSWRFVRRRGASRAWNAVLVEECRGAAQAPVLSLKMFAYVGCVAAARSRSAAISSGVAILLMIRRSSLSPVSRSVCIPWLMRNLAAASA